MRLSRVVRRMLGVAFVSVASVAAAGAQAVRGIVVDNAGTPVPGVVVQLLDASSRASGRALTNERGEFRLSAAAGTYRIHTLRIGFRPTDSEPISLQAGADVTRRIVLTDLPVGLDTVRVAGRNACRALNDSGEAFAAWEQIRAAITAASLTAAARSIFTTTVAYERTLEPDARRVRTQTSSVHSGYVREPWGSRSPDALHADGYVVTDRQNVTTYYAPGLDVLLSPSFVEDHCFHLTRDRERLGLAFEPNPDRRKTPDIRGTLWLDAKTAELRTMEFRYSNVLPEQDAVARGEASFIRMTNGTWAISRWSIRMPVLEQVAGSEVRGGARLQVVPGEVRLQATAVHVAGGELALARLGTDTLWTRPLVALAGTVVDSSSGKAIGGARLSLVGTNLRDSTDAHGRFSIGGVLLGEYTMEIRTPSLDSVNALHQIPVAFTDSATPLELRVPNASQLVAMVCGATKLEWQGIVVGTVTSPGDSIPPRNVKVTAGWTQRFLPVGEQSVEQVSRRAEWLDTRTDAHGMFRLCGVPIDNSIALTVGDGGGAPVYVRIPADGRFTRAELTLDRTPRNDVAAFVGTVTDSAGRPVITADVSLPGLSKSTATDAGGAFRIDGVPAGTQHVLVRRLGYRAIDTSLVFSADRTVQRRFELVRAVTLDSVIVTESAVDNRMWSFDENRRVGLGHFLTRAELAKLEGGLSTAAILESIPGLGVARSKVGNRSWVTSSRSRRLVQPDGNSHQLGANSSCYSQVYLDDVLMYNSRDGEALFDANSISPSEIEAIEYYASAADTPARYSGLNSTCGVLVIWTLRFHSRDTTATFTGLVTDSTKTPLARVEVTLPDLGKGTLTNEHGEFSLRDVPAGSQRISARHVGYAPVELRQTFDGGQTVQRHITMIRTTTLDSVIVSGKSVDHALDDFEVNRKLGLGHFLTRAELAPQEGRSTAAVLTSLPGIKIFTMGPYAWVGSGRHNITSISTSQTTVLDDADLPKNAPLWDCYALVYLDDRIVWRGQKFPGGNKVQGGTQHWEPLFDINSIPVAEIEAIEYYASAAQTPASYATLNSECGVLVIHTLRYHPKDTTAVSPKPPAHDR
jgi:Carboxypeptidase regulatory-like domain/CarboxypepD_reg-like domain